MERAPAPKDAFPRRQPATWWGVASGVTALVGRSNEQEKEPLLVPWSKTGGEPVGREGTGDGV